MQNPYAPSAAGADTELNRTTTLGQTFVRRAIRILIGGIAGCLFAEFAAQYLDLHGFRGNSKAAEKLLRAVTASLLFTGPYLVMSSPLVLLQTARARHSLGFPGLGGAFGVLVPRTWIGYFSEVQAAIGLDGTTLVFFAAGCGAVAGCLAEVWVRMATMVFRSTTA